MARSLYICYFGVREPLVQTQVLPYLRELAKAGHEMRIVTFEPDISGLESYGVTKLRDELAEQGIGWLYLKYHKRFSALATAWDILAGAAFVRVAISRYQLEILHGRSHVATLMGALGRRLAGRKPKLIFDIRGFFPEEYTDAGVWPENGVLFRTTKRIEKWLLRQADGFVVLTGKAKRILFGDTPQRPVEVIPCCVDLRRFESANEEARAAMRAELGIGGRFVAAYVGAFGGWYLTQETAEFLGELKRKRPDTFAMILTQSDPAMIEPMLREAGFGSADVLISKVAAAEVPRYLSAADLAVSFIKNCYSKQASSPTKNAEYLACGLPIIANSGIGDVDELVDGDRVGVLIDRFDRPAYSAVVDAALAFDQPSEHMREVAAREFDLVSVGGARYRSLYERVMGGDAG